MKETRMRTISREDIIKVLDPEAVIQAVRDAFVAHSAGRCYLPNPLHLVFQDGKTVEGDCHVKAAAVDGASTFAIKVATGFYRNPERNLPVNNGLVLIFDRQTGAPVALIQDGGLMTSYRTAAAGVLAMELASPVPEDTLGVVGAGSQAGLQARWIARAYNITKLRVLALNPADSAAFAASLRADGLDAQPVENATELCRTSRLVVTATPSSVPVIRAADLSRPVHIVGIGADGPEKTEIAPGVFAAADHVIVDDIEQGKLNGDFGHALRFGINLEGKVETIGQRLAGKWRVGAGQTSIVDLTGLGVQDQAMAELVWSWTGTEGGPTRATG
jgi:ornithine cyclodeaminase/alanine dehydrogenase-like protein (mu-crystallin family)